MFNTSNDNVLNEIGELFGQYKNRDEYGRVEIQDFQSILTKNLNDIRRVGTKKSNDPLKTFDQLLKLETSRVNRSNKKNTNLNDDPFMRSVLNTCFNETEGGRHFYQWQKQVISQLQNKDNDVYVVAPPGGGKTTPLMAHYIVDLFMGGTNGVMSSVAPEKILESNRDEKVIKKWSDIFHGLLTGKYMNGNPVPRCLFITPIRVLSFEQAEGFQEYFIDLMLFLRSIVEKSSKQNDKEDFHAYTARLKNGSSTNIDAIVGNVFGSAGKEAYKSIASPIQEFESDVRTKTRKMICVKTGGGSESFNSEPDQAIVTIATYGSAKGFISKISHLVKFIVFDEAHLYMPSEYGGTSDRSQESEVNAASDAYTIIHGMAKQKAQIAFLSGTIHPVSARNFCDFLNKNYNRRLSVVATEKGDTESGNKTELRVIPDDSIRDEREQVNRIVKWIQNNEKGNAIILFSKRKINKLVDEAIKKLSQKDIRGDKDINPSASLSSKDEIIKRYNESIKLANPQATAQDIKRAIDDFVKKKFPTPQQDIIEKIKAKPGAMMIENTKLRNAVAYGIGYIYRQDDAQPNENRGFFGEDDGGPIPEKDKLIIADLFSKGKINVLLATAAIGVGVNVSIKNMYLPSCMKYEKNKYNEGKMDLNNKREMSQLVNRTGRGKTPISGIYTPREFVPFMREVVMSGNDDFNKVPAISFQPSDNLKDVLMKLSDAVPSKISGPIFKSASITKTTGSFIYNKIRKFSNFVKNLKQTDNEKLSEPGYDEEKFEDERKQIERLEKFSNTYDKIQEYDQKLLELEKIEQKVLEKIFINQSKLNSTGKYSSNRPSDAERAKLLRWIAMGEAVLTKIQNDQNTYVTKEFNEIKKEIIELGKETTLTKDGFHNYNNKRHNITVLNKRLDEISKKYNPKLFGDRNAAIEEIRRQISEQRSQFNAIAVIYSKINNDNSISQNEKDYIKSILEIRRKTIEETLNKITKIDFYDFPTQQSKKTYKSNLNIN